MPVNITLTVWVNVAAGLLLLTLLVAFVWLRPLQFQSLFSVAAPSDTYEAARVRLEALKGSETTRISAECLTALLGHGRKTRRVIVLLHGYTTCPQQLLPFGELFYKQGYNVLIPRLPYHGLSNRTTTHVSKLNAEDLTAFGDEVLDIACGLGEHVTVVGLSAGGVVAAWLAQLRDEVDLAVMLSPSIGSQAVPAWLTQFWAGILLTLPNRFLWWDREKKAEHKSRRHMYAHYSTRAFGEILRLALFVLTLAKRNPPAANAAFIVRQSFDPAVNLRLAEQLVRFWRQTAKQDKSRFAIASLPENIVTQFSPMSYQEGKRTNTSFLVELITRY